MWEEVVGCSESECKCEARMFALDYVCNAGKYMNVRLLFKKCMFQVLIVLLCILDLCRLMLSVVMGILN